MLFGEHPNLVDFDPHHFRNLMEMVFPKRDGHGRLYVVYEDGQVLKGYHTVQGHIRDYPWPLVDDPTTIAHQLLEEFQVKSVALLDRTAVEDYFAELQQGHRLGEDMFEFVARGMDLWRQRFAEKITVMPQPFANFDTARLRLAAAGLYDAVPDGHCVVLVVLEGNEIWTSVILGIKDRAIDLATSLMPLSITGEEVTEWQQLPSLVIPSVERHLGPVAIGLFMQLPEFQEMLAADNWIAWVSDMAARKRIVVASSAPRVDNQ